MDHMSGAEGPEEDAEMEEASSDEHTPAPEEEAEASEQAGDAAAGPSRVHDRIPVSCNKRLKREFRARKSLAGAVPPHIFTSNNLSCELQNGSGPDSSSGCGSESQHCCGNAHMRQCDSICGCRSVCDCWSERCTCNEGGVR